VLSVYRVCVCGGSILYTRCLCVSALRRVCVFWESWESSSCSALRVLSLIRNKQLKPVSHSFQASRPPWNCSCQPRISTLVARHRGNCQPQRTAISQATQSPNSRFGTASQDMSETLTNSNTQNTYLSLSSKAIVSSHNLWSTASAHITHFTPIECDSLINNNCSSAVTQCAMERKKWASRV
jgi:hypothetical protein